MQVGQSQDRIMQSQNSE